jgi:hypothetical protein
MTARASFVTTHQSVFPPFCPAKLTQPHAQSEDLIQTDALLSFAAGIATAPLLYIGDVVA